jgi:hypothetical protein
MREQHWSAVLFALAFPVPVLAVTGSMMVVVNERVLHRHVFPAAEVSGLLAVVAMLVAAWWGERR